MSNSIDLDYDFSKDVSCIRNMIKGSVLITGGTGTFGHALVDHLLTHTTIAPITILSRDELKQYEMKKKYSNNDRLKFIIGDVRNPEVVNRVVSCVDVIFHAAAMKHIDLVEDNPYEGISTNIIGTQNIVQACINNATKSRTGNTYKTLIGISTDKAAAAHNLYGATKFCMEKLISYAGKQPHVRSLVFRYGNVIGSRGSVFHTFTRAIKNNQPITITHNDMTRFSFTIQQAVSFVIQGISQKNIESGSIIVPKLKSYNINDMIKAVLAKNSIINEYPTKITGIREGEKLHEAMITNNEVQNTRDMGTYFVIENRINEDTKTRPSSKFTSYTAKRLTIEEIISTMSF